MKKSLFGFTLLELLVTMLIGAILAAMVIPSFREMTQNAQANSTYNAFIGELAYARSEAVKRGRAVAICASSDAASCNTDEWELGRVVFVETSVDGALGLTEEVIKAFPRASGPVTVRTMDMSYTREVALPSSAFDDVMVFSAQGRPSHTGTFVVCNAQGTEGASGINLTIMGLAQRARDTDATPDGVVNAMSGDEVTCP